MHIDTHRPAGPTPLDRVGCVAIVTHEAAAHLNRLHPPGPDVCKMGNRPEQLTLFALPKTCPSWPRHGTLAHKALVLLLGGRSLDHPTFDAEVGSWRLAAVVFELRAQGWPIRSADVPAPIPECPSRRIAIYRLCARDLVGLLTEIGCAQA